MLDRIKLYGRQNRIVKLLAENRRPPSPQDKILTVDTARYFFTQWTADCALIMSRRYGQRSRDRLSDDVTES